MTQPKSEVTQIIEALDAGDPQAAERLLPLVYDELRNLAAASLANEQPGQTLQPTALVHEAYLRLVGGPSPKEWTGRGHFFSAAAIAIRRILIESARRKQSLKRGGELARRNLDDQPLSVPEPSEDLVALNDSLERLGEVDSQAADLVQLRYFAGLTLDEAAQSLGVSPRTARRLWTFARAWLRHELEAEGSPST